jgi:hypothetical protein
MVCVDVSNKIYSPWQHKPETKCTTMITTRITKKMDSLKVDNNIWENENYGFAIVDEDDVGYKPEDKARIMTLFQRNQNLREKNIAAQRTRWNNRGSIINLLNRMESMSMKQLNETKKTSRELKKLVRKGIPPELRGRIWFLLSGALARMKEQKDDRLYFQLLEQNRGVVTDATKQVDADIDRTFSTHPFFSDKTNQDLLRNILYTYSFYNPKIGYCQSMNYLAGVLLLHMPEEHAFWTLDVILHDYLPEDLYDPTMNGLKCEVYVLSRLVADRIPRVANHLKRTDIDFLLFSTRWFMCLFLNSVPMETAFCIWDSFLLEGYKILFRIGITILQSMEKRLLACKDMAQALKLIDQYPKELFDCQSLMKSSFKIRQFSKSKIEKIRQQYRANQK